MVNKKFMLVFLGVFTVTITSSFIIWRALQVPKKSHVAQKPTEQSSACSYEDIDLIMPVHAFLKRGANSTVQSYVRRLFAHQWISSNQAGVIKLVSYVQGAMSYEAIKKAFLVAIEKEGKSSAASFVLGAIKRIDSKPELIEHINASLLEGYSQDILTLRGSMAGLDSDSLEYKRLKIQYKKKLDIWIDQKYGKLLDEIISEL